MTQSREIGENDLFIANSDVSTISKSLDGPFDGVYIEADTRREFEGRKLERVAMSTRWDPGGQAKHRINDTTTMVF
jgi:hypothetical protein